MALTFSKVTGPDGNVSVIPGGVTVTDAQRRIADSGIRNATKHITEYHGLSPGYFTNALMIDRPDCNPVGGNSNFRAIGTAEPDILLVAGVVACVQYMQDDEKLAANFDALKTSHEIRTLVRNVIRGEHRP